MKLSFNFFYHSLFLSVFLFLFSCKSLQKVQNNQDNSSLQIQQLEGGKTVEYVSKSEGKVLILKDDLEPFFEELGDLELEIRLQGKLEGNSRADHINQFKEFMAGSVLEWDSVEIAEVKVIFEEVYELCNQVSPHLFPKNLQLILTNGKEENGAYYTRDAAIIIPRPNVKRIATEMGRKHFLSTMVHEVFHVYSRLHPKKQLELYQLIGYEKIDQLDIGSMLKKRKLTNPDGVNYRYKIEVTSSNGKTIPTILMIYSKHPKFEAEKGSFFQYLAFDLFEIEQVAKGWQVVNGDKPTPLPINKVSGFREQVGNNTDYIIHPDEILADNVAILAISKKEGELPSRVDEFGKELLEEIEGGVKQK